MMKNLINTVLGSDAKLSDEMLANNTLQGAKGSSAAYLTATLESATPEVRRMFSEFLTQSIMSHESLTNLAIKKGCTSRTKARTSRLPRLTSRPVGRLARECRLSNT